MWPYLHLMFTAPTRNQHALSWFDKPQSPVALLTTPQSPPCYHQKTSKLGYPCAFNASRCFHYRTEPFRYLEFLFCKSCEEQTHNLGKGFTTSTIFPVLNPLSCFRQSLSDISVGNLSRSTSRLYPIHVLHTEQLNNINS